MNHTPGPWAYDAASGEISMADDEGIACHVATVNFDNTDPPQAHADGRLIAAAPDLLTAMDALCEYVERFGEISEAPADSACWTALENARALRTRICNEGAPT